MGVGNPTAQMRPQWRAYANRGNRNAQFKKNHAPALTAPIQPAIDRRSEGLIPTGVDEQGVFMTTIEAEKCEAISPLCVERMRGKGGGPLYCKLGRGKRGRVVYDRSAFLTWATRSFHTITSQYGTSRANSGGNKERAVELTGRLVSVQAMPPGRKSLP